MKTNIQCLLLFQVYEIDANFCTFQNSALFCDPVVHKFGTPGMGPSLRHITFLDQRLQGEEKNTIEY